MSEYIGIEEARGRLGDLVTAAQQGADIILTRRDRPVVRLVALLGASTVTGTEVVEQMSIHAAGRAGHEPFHLIEASRRAAAVILGEREHDQREAVQMRIIEVSLRGIAEVCDALGVDPDALDEQPAALATIGQARTVMDAIISRGV